MNEHLMEYMEKVREYYREKSVYKGRVEADELIRRILGRPGLEPQHRHWEMPIHTDLGLDGLKGSREGLNSSWAVTAEGPITSHRRFIGKFLVFGKKVVRKLLRWYINPVVDQQRQFNSSATTAVNEITNKLILMERNFKVIDQRLRELNEGYKKQKGLEEFEEAFNEELEKLRSDLAYLSYKVKQPQQAAGIKQADGQQPAKGEFDPGGAEIDYFAFENRFRGTEAQVKERLREYLPYFNQQNVLDIGCGRGEFLELMAENNISAKGVDVYRDFVDYCTNKGLDVQLGDAVGYLESVPDNSLGGIFMGQVVEHLEPRYLARVIELSCQKLKPGAFLVAETPNPAMLSTLSNSFYLDLTHVKPIHPETLRFLCQYFGFGQADIRYSQASKIPYSLALLEGDGSIRNLEKFNEGINLLNDLLFGYQDYAVIAKK